MISIKLFASIPEPPITLPHIVNCIAYFADLIIEGKMPERLNGTVSKTVYRHCRYEGSNPSLSALDRRSEKFGGQGP